VLPAVLVYSLLIALVSVSALRGSAVEIRVGARQQEMQRANNLADVLVEMLARRVVERWPEGGVYCSARRYCEQDFPSLAALLDEIPPGWQVDVDLLPSDVLPTLRHPTAQASSAGVYQWHYLDATVSIDGSVQVSRALGLALPVVVAGGDVWP
jgi:hypothetical protein